MTRRFKLNLAQLLPILGAVLLIAAVACGGAASEPGTSAGGSAASSTIAPVATQAAPDAASSPIDGGLVQMSAYADTKDWDPVGSGSLSSVQAYSQLYNQLVQYDRVDTAKVVGDLASSWEITNAGQTFTFKLNDGIKWQDGEDLTAEDVVFSMERYMNAKNVGRSGLFRNYTLPIDEGGVKLIDDKTIEFNLQFASGAFINFLAIDYVKVLPKHLLEQDIDLNQAENIIANKSGSGPYILEEYQRGNTYKVTKNPNYFKDGLPHFDGIEHFIITDTGTMTAQFLAGQIDMMNGGFSNLNPTEYQQLADDSNGAIILNPLGNTRNWGVMLNIKKGPLVDSKVRKAIYLALDRQQLNELLEDNTAGPPSIFGGMAYSDAEAETWPGLRPKDSAGGKEDLAEAKRLMAEAGFADGFNISFSARQVGNYPDMCALVKQQLKNTLGIDGELSTFPSAPGYALYATSREAEGDWGIACQGEGMVVIDPDGVYGGVYRHGGTRNYTNWTSQTIEDIFEEQKKETDPARRIELNKQAADFLRSFEDNHWVTAYWGKFFWLVSKDIKNFHAPKTVQTHFKHEELWLDR